MDASFAHVRKTCDGYIVVYDFFEMHYDESGQYVGQSQPNMLDDDGPPFLFFKAECESGTPCVNGKPVPPLSAAEMASADHSFS